VNSASKQSHGTVKGGDATCPYPDCARVIGGDQVKAQAQAGGMGEQLFAVVFKKQVITGYTKETKKKLSSPKFKWERGYRAPRPEDDNRAAIETALAVHMPEWEALDVVPNEAIGEPSNYERGHIMYGMRHWRDLFSSRQLLCHAISVKIFQEIVQEEMSKSGGIGEEKRAALGYIALALDKLRDYNSRMTRWHSIREVMVNTFDSHNFAMRWSYVEMSPLIDGLGHDWAFGQVAKCIGELIKLIDPHKIHDEVGGPLFASSRIGPKAPIKITCKSVIPWIILKAAV
jgi:adenine-specific DNA methylase